MNVRNIDKFEIVLRVQDASQDEIQSSYLLRVGIVVILASIPCFGIAYLICLIPSGSEAYRICIIANLVFTLVVAAVTWFAEKYSYPIPIFDAPFFDDVSIASLLDFPFVASRQTEKQDVEFKHDAEWIQKRLPKVYVNYCRYVIVMGMLGLWFFALEIHSARLHILSLLNCACPLIALYFGARNYPSRKRLEEMYVNFFRAQQRFSRIFK